MAKKVKKIRVPRTRNAETMTESAFWGWLRSGLRARSVFWKPIAEAKKKARTVYRGTNKRQKWQFQCNHCKKQFKDKETVVDHIIPAGSLRCYDDLPGFVERLFCEVDGFQVLCKPCHQEKTNKERKTKK